LPDPVNWILHRSRSSIGLQILDLRIVDLFI